jgi:hypothetical protein
MMHSWIGERMGEQHRRDLTASARPAIQWDTEGADPDLMVAVRTDLGDQVVHAHTWPDSLPRRAIAPSVGALLIRMGTRLGGTSMRTS